MRWILSAAALTGAVCTVMVAVACPWLPVALWLIGNAAIAAWWGVHVFVTRSPW